MNIQLLRPIQGGRVSQWFGANPANYVKYLLPGHNGIDYAVRQGTPVMAAHAGVLHLPTYDPHGYGIYCIVQAGPYYTLYAHLVDRAGRQPGDQIDAGELLGYVGSTGNSTGPHLHFGLRLTRAGYQAQPYKGWLDPWPFRD